MNEAKYKKGIALMRENQYAQPYAPLISGLFVALIYSPSVAHIYHLQSDSYAQHMALGAYYEAAPAAVDAFIEAYQGSTGALAVLGGDNPVELSQGGPLDYFNTLSALVAEFMENGGFAPEVADLLSAIAALVDGVLYKLENLS